MRGSSKVICIRDAQGKEWSSYAETSNDLEAWKYALQGGEKPTSLSGTMWFRGDLIHTVTLLTGTATRLANMGYRRGGQPT
jgi:hypothetical protein